MSFKTCKVTYHVHNEEKERKIYRDHPISNQWEYESALRRLAFCLSEQYIQKKDTETKEKIIEIYKYKFEFYNRDNTFKKINFDSILVHRKEVFNSEILVD